MRRKAQQQQDMQKSAARIDGTGLYIFPSTQTDHILQKMMEGQPLGTFNLCRSAKEGKGRSPHLLQVNIFSIPSANHQK
jgi:hypothetical protein